MRLLHLSLLGFVAALTMVGASMAAMLQPVAADSTAQAPVTVAVPTEIEEQNTLYLIEYGNQGRRCYVIRTHKSGAGHGSDGSDSEVSCNNLPVLGLPIKTIALANIEKDTLYTVTNSKSGDVCTLLRTEKKRGDADVSMDCSFGN